MLFVLSGWVDEKWVDQGSSSWPSSSLKVFVLCLNPSPKSKFKVSYLNLPVPKSILTELQGLTLTFKRFFHLQNIPPWLPLNLTIITPIFYSLLMSVNGSLLLLWQEPTHFKEAYCQAKEVPILVRKSRAWPVAINVKMLSSKQGCTLSYVSKLRGENELIYTQNSCYRTASTKELFKLNLNQVHIKWIPVECVALWICKPSEILPLCRAQAVIRG